MVTYYLYIPFFKNKIPLAVPGVSGISSFENDHFAWPNTSRYEKVAITFSTSERTSEDSLEQFVIEDYIVTKSIKHLCTCTKPFYCSYNVSMHNECMLCFMLSQLSWAFNFLVLDKNGFKGTVSRDFRTSVFFFYQNIRPALEDIRIFFKCMPCHWHRMHDTCGVIDIACKGNIYQKHICSRIVLPHH
jgi:hypothetical protein